MKTKLMLSARSMSDKDQQPKGKKEGLMNYSQNN